MKRRELTDDIGDDSEEQRKDEVKEQGLQDGDDETGAEKGRGGSIRI